MAQNSLLQTTPHKERYTAIYIYISFKIILLQLKYKYSYVYNIHSKFDLKKSIYCSSSCAGHNELY